MKDTRAFFSTVDRYSGVDAAMRAELEAQIWQHHGVDRAVLVLDMTAYSLSMQSDGVLPYLSRIRRMQVLIEPLVEAFEGEIIEYKADNLFASFADADAALQAALQMRAQLSEPTLPQPVSIGLSHGRILLVAGIKAYGLAVNTAFKLGEDIAASDEILACPRFIEALGDKAAAHATEIRSLSIAGLPTHVYRIKPQA